MFNFSLISGPLFFAGVFNGINKRAEPDFIVDPRAHYKLMGMTTCLSTMYALNNYFKDNPLTTKPRFSAHLTGGSIGGFLLSGTAYCMGLMLTKIPSKRAMDY